MVDEAWRMHGVCAYGVQYEIYMQRVSEIIIRRVRNTIDIYI